MSTSARLLVAASASGGGKTTIACGLMRAFQRRGLRVRAAKCGPDFIDPLFHSRVVGAPSSNLDTFLADGPQVRSILARRACGADLTVVEGVMGYYDGIASSTRASSYDIARMTGTPVLLVVDGRGRGLSVAAELLGFMQFRTPCLVAGVLVNRVSDAYYPVLADAIEREVGLPVLGYVPALSDAQLESRHLGLVAADEVADLQEKIDAIACALERTVDLDAVWKLACRAEPLAPGDARGVGFGGDLCHAPANAPCIAVARDEAFSFYYDETLQLLERLGARLSFFSPLHDRRLPEDVAGLYLGGGYPELHAPALAQNEAMRGCIAAAIRNGMPAIAECGGFLYLHEHLEDADGIAWPMAGVVCGRAKKSGRLRRFGYVTLHARTDSLLACAGEELRAHEFHYWDSTDPGNAFVAVKPNSERRWDTGIATPTLYAAFPHLYLPGCPQAAERFVERCRERAAISRPAP